MKPSTAYFNSPYKKECLKLAEKLYSMGWEIYCSSFLSDIFSSGDFTFTELESGDFFEIRKAMEKGYYRDGSFSIKSPDLLVLDSGENLKSGFERASMSALVYQACSLVKLPLILCETQDFEKVLEKIKILGELPEETIKFYASRALHRFSFYQACLAEKLYPFSLEHNSGALPLEKKRKLSYGENPHQKAFFYSIGSKEEERFSGFRSPNLNHETDTQKASSLIFRCEEAGACFFKHGNLAGFFLGENIFSALKKTRAYTAGQLYGSVCCFNRLLEEDALKEVLKIGPELICAPDFSREALKILRKSENSSFMKLPFSFSPGRNISFYFHEDAFLVQEKDEVEIFRYMEIASQRKPSLEELRNLKYAALLSSFVGPYSCLLFADNCLIASSGPQPSVREAASVAAFKMRSVKRSWQSLKIVAASSAPFTLEALEEMSFLPVTAFVCPAYGFEKERIVPFVNNRKLAAVLTSKRHFRH